MYGLNRFLMHEIEMPLIEIVADMESTGYPVDTQYFHDLRGRLEPEVVKIREGISKVAGEQFNPKSPKQLSKLLYETLGLTAIKRTKAGALSTDSATLDQLDSKHPVIAKLIRFRELNKILSTYCTIPN